MIPVMKNDKLPLELEAARVAKAQKFVIEKEMYRGSFYSPRHVRNLIYSGRFAGKPAILKIYDDPRLTDEPRSLAAFHQANKSKKLAAPTLYAWAMASPYAGWMIVERLPAGGTFFQTPLTATARKEFLAVYREYRNFFPSKPTRELELAEQLPADEFTSLRLNRFLALAHEKEAARAMKGEKRLFTSKDIRLYTEGIQLVRAGLHERPMTWCHGHFKPQEVYKTKQGKYYLLDFAHTHLFPQGYEFGFMVWADHLMTLQEKSSFKEVKNSIDQWIQDFTPIAKELRWDYFASLARVSLLERILGTIFADIGASDQPFVVKRQKIDLLWKVFDALKSKVV